MKATDLLGSRVVDRHGEEVGTVRDLRARPEDGGLTLCGLVVGRGAIAERLGYAYGEVEGPWVVARLMQRLGRRARYVAWEDVGEFSDGVLRLGVEAAALPHAAETRSGHGSGGEE